jgi:acyl-coenzyme A thioesterase PaaI-like protein
MEKMEKGEERFYDNDYCFACGSKNPLGLNLMFHLHDDGACTTEFTASPHHQGFRDVLHGGLVATIADDLMNNHLFRMYGVSTATAELSTRFKKPTPLGVPLVFTSRRVQTKGRVHEMACEVRVKDDETVLAICKGRFIEIAF